MSTPDFLTAFNKKHLEGAYTATLKQLQAAPALAARIHQIALVVNQVLFETAPSDLGRLTKLGFFPYTEASTDAALALTFVQHGAYKTAYFHLRAFFELHLMAVYFLSPNVSEVEAREWLRSQEMTPFFKAVLKTLFKEPVFLAADKALDLQERLKAFFYRTSDIIHTRGAQHAHSALAKSNVPRFIPETLERFIRDAEDALGLVITCLGLRSPVIMVPLPLFEKCSLNPPLSGFLEEEDIAALRGFLDDKSLVFLEAVAAADDFAQGAKEHFEGLPDIPQEELQQQIKHQGKFLCDMGGNTPGDNDDSTEE
jgi:hypothetical protein